MFQTLPGIIPRFYFVCVYTCTSNNKFQTLPGIIPRFYLHRTIQTLNGTSNVSNPSRDYSAFLRERSSPGQLPIDECFKPFQGLFRVSTLLEACPKEPETCSFKPFQGLFRVSTHEEEARQMIFVGVSNPSRDYSAFLQKYALAYSEDGLSFKPFQGLFRVSTLNTVLENSPPLQGFKPFQGLFRVSTFMVFSP
ncbi:hypothetical protein U27_01555 [Candidatus Vecturithrix granuli]|uniref:Uncharacterized protein n=1 Tax=Vecturithrix granuli TaxID=1499967 RepID=A0A081CAP9_VECG1|nr:hypothetical protein U27_01555 [Candidatus Vecturithrix granuli]